MVMTIRNFNANDYKIKICVMQMMQDVMKSMKLEKYLNYTELPTNVIFGRVKHVNTPHTKKLMSTI